MNYERIFEGSLLLLGLGVLSFFAALIHLPKAAVKFGWREVAGSLLLFRRLRYFSDHSFYFLLHIARGCIIAGLLLGIVALIVMVFGHLLGILGLLVVPSLSGGQWHPSLPLLRC